MRMLLVILFIGTISFASAQVTIHQSSSVEALISQHKETQKAVTKMSGYSVQLLATSERSKVTEMKALFLNTYPNIKVDWEYTAPYYRLQAGAFLTKWEATRLLYQIQSNFPDAYIVKNNNIAPVDLL